MISSLWMCQVMWGGKVKINSVDAKILTNYAYENDIPVKTIKVPNTDVYGIVFLDKKYWNEQTAWQIISSYAKKEDTDAK